MDEQQIKSMHQQLLAAAYRRTIRRVVELEQPKIDADVASALGQPAPVQVVESPHRRRCHKAHGNGFRVSEDVQVLS